MGVKLSSRFIAGMNIEDAVRACASVNAQGMAVTLDALGESVTDAAAAHRAADAFLITSCWTRLPKAQAECQRKREAYPDGSSKWIAELAEADRALDLAEAMPPRWGTLCASTWRTRR